LARRIRDPLLAEEEVRDERRRTPRAHVLHEARLRAGDLTLAGTIHDAGGGGVFLATNLLIEVGERGTLLTHGLEVAVQVVWLRGNAHASGPGMGLVFDEPSEQVAQVLERLGG
jgi:hypothetical protein